MKVTCLLFAKLSVGDTILCKLKELKWVVINPGTLNCKEYIRKVHSNRG